MKQVFLTQLQCGTSPETWNFIPAASIAHSLSPTVCLRFYTFLTPAHLHIPFHSKAVGLATGTKDLKCSDFPLQIASECPEIKAVVSPWPYPLLNYSSKSIIRLCSKISLYITYKITDPLWSRQRKCLLNLLFI